MVKEIYIQEIWWEVLLVPLERSRIFRTGGRRGETQDPRGWRFDSKLPKLSCRVSIYTKTMGLPYGVGSKPRGEKRARPRMSVANGVDG